MLQLNHCNMLISSSQPSFKLFNLGIFLIIHASQLDKLSNQGLVLVIYQLIIVLQIIMSPLVNIMLNNSLQLLKLFLLMSLNIQHLKFIFSFLLMSLFFKRLNLLLHLMIFLFDLFTISLLITSLLYNSFLITSLFVISLNRWTIFLATFSLSLLGRRIIRT